MWKNQTHHYNIPFSGDPDTVRAARRDSTCSFYQPPPPTDIEKIRSNMVKEQKVFALIREILGRRSTSIRHMKQCNPSSDANGGCLCVMQPTWDSCGCCSWWRTVRGTPTLTFWHNTFGRASAEGSLTVWVLRKCSTGQTQLCWATYLESTQVSKMGYYQPMHTTDMHDCMKYL